MKSTEIFLKKMKNISKDKFNKDHFGQLPDLTDQDMNGMIALYHMLFKKNAKVKVKRLTICTSVKMSANTYTVAVVCWMEHFISTIPKS